MEELNLPSTDNAAVMHQAVSAWITGQVWAQLARATRDEEAEDTLVQIYDRVYRSVAKTHSQA